MELERSEVDAIARSTAQPTFHNTIVALTYTGETARTRHYAHVQPTFGQTRSDEFGRIGRTDVATLERTQRKHHAQRAVVPSSARCLRGREANPTLTGEDAMLLQDTYDGFVRSGAALPEEKRGRYKEVKAELAKLSLQFSQNNIKETNDFVLL